MSQVVVLGSFFYGTITTATKIFLSLSVGHLFDSIEYK
jgi:hypothetical protein